MGIRLESDIKKELKDKAVGSFAIRISPLQTGKLSVGYINENGKFGQFLLEVDDGIAIHTSNDIFAVYPTLIQFVNCCSLTNVLYGNIRKGDIKFTI